MAIIVGEILEDFSHKKVLVSGALLMSCSIAAFGFIDDIESKQGLIALSVFLRLLQGIASGMLDTSAYAFVSTAYPEKVEGVISVLEAGTGIGNMMGPVLGSFVF